ncbi:MAG: RNA 2',3'-cyclic phosphodiesterase [Candidatus Aenigmarchaeota archaeon]|nr:RNA 2',3'-cyclic phosphodiesterase [Candidatus Aenigmarchaeota archaeon]
MRCFISAEFPEKIKKQIEEIQKSFGVNKAIRFTSKKNMHITLKFLGDIDSDTVRDIKYSIEKKLADIRAPDIAIEALEAFPNTNFIRGVWLRLTSRELKQIKEDLDSIDTIKRCTQDTHNIYLIHATLFRTGKIDEKTRKHIAEKIEKVNKTMKKSSFVIDRIELKKSELKKEGPIYTTISSYHLKNTDR